MQTPPETSPFFLKIRAITFSILSLAALLWIISLSIIVFTQWNVLGSSERSLVFLMLTSHCITAVILLVLLILAFRPWLDAARIAFLLIAQLGTAGAFAYWYPRFQCSPQVLVLYSFGLGLLVWKRSSSSSPSPLPSPKSIRSTTSSEATIDLEKASEISNTGPSTLFVGRPDRMTQASYANTSPPGSRTAGDRNTVLDITNPLPPALSMIVRPGRMTQASYGNTPLPSAQNTNDPRRAFNAMKSSPPSLSVARPNRLTPTAYTNSPLSSARHEQFLDVFTTDSLYNISPYTKQGFDSENPNQRGSLGRSAARLSRPAPAFVG